MQHLTCALFAPTAHSQTDGEDAEAAGDADANALYSAASDAASSVSTSSTSTRRLLGNDNSGAGNSNGNGEAGSKSGNGNGEAGSKSGNGGGSVRLNATAPRSPRDVLEKLKANPKFAANATVSKIAQQRLAGRPVLGLGRWAWAC